MSPTNYDAKKGMQPTTGIYANKKMGMESDMGTTGLLPAIPHSSGTNSHLMSYEESLVRGVGSQIYRPTPTNTALMKTGLFASSFQSTQRGNAE